MSPIRIGRNSTRAEREPDGLSSGAAVPPVSGAVGTKLETCFVIDKRTAFSNTANTFENDDHKHNTRSEASKAGVMTTTPIFKKSSALT